MCDKYEPLNLGISSLKMKFGSCDSAVTSMISLYFDSFKKGYY